ncbi:hypothetical protein [Pseudomonas putida]
MDNSDRTTHAPPSPGSNQDHLHSIADEAGAMLDEAKSKGTEQYTQYRDVAAEELDSLQEGVRSAASALEGKDSLGLSQYLAQAAECLGNFAGEVRQLSAEELLHKGSRLARDNPGMFLAGSVAIGFGLSRFLGASARHAPASAPAAYGASEPYHSTPPTPDRASDVSTHKPFTPVDPLEAGTRMPTADTPLYRDPLKGGE